MDTTNRAPFWLGSLRRISNCSTGRETIGRTFHPRPLARYDVLDEKWELVYQWYTLYWYRFLHYYSEIIDSTLSSKKLVKFRIVFPFHQMRNQRFNMRLYRAYCCISVRDVDCPQPSEFDPYLALRFPKIRCVHPSKRPFWLCASVP